jgi:nucleotide-binding universal stress UspA family protein
MYRRILVAYDGSPESRLALDECIRLAPGPAASVHLAGVVHDPSLYVLAGEYVPEIALGDDEARVDADIKDAAAQLAAHGLAVTPHVVVGEPVSVIARLVEELGIDLLILGHPRSTTFALRWWRGSTDALLLERVRCSILVAAGPERD